MSDKHAAGKGSRYRAVDEEKYRKNYEAIFGKKETKNGRSKDHQTDNRRGDSKQGGGD